MSSRKKNWTVDDIPDLSGKVIVVTGANSGIGFESALEFSRKGAQTILACRNMEKADAALAAIQKECPDAAVEIMLLDLADLSSVRSFAEAFKSRYERLDVLLNNAGIMMVPYGKTVDGFERQLGTNHLGHFALTGLLLGLIQKTPGARVVNVSSTGHRMGKMDFDNLMYEKGRYSSTGAYGRAKLANLLFTYELQRLFDAHGVDALGLAAHPGGSDTHLGDHLKDTLFFKLVVPIFAGLMMQSAAMGALPSIRACVDPDAKAAEYYGPRGFMETRGFPVVVKSNKASHNTDDAHRLWEVSTELTGVEYPWSS